MGENESQAQRDARDQADAIIRSWDEFEKSRGSQPIIDYDLLPCEAAALPIPTPEAVHRLKAIACASSDEQLLEYLSAHIAYGEALTTGQWDFLEYVEKTQGVRPTRWPMEDILRARRTAESSLQQLGIELGPDTRGQLDAQEQLLQAHEVEAAILDAAWNLKSQVGALVGGLAPFEVSVHVVDDPSVYWAYWLDGVGMSARLRINVRNAHFTDVTAIQFAIHEVLGHAAQAAAWHRQLKREPTSWPRISAIHTPQQVLLEGWAQALPLYLENADGRLTARVRLLHYWQLCLAQAHMDLQEGVDIDGVQAWLEEYLPWLTPREVAIAIRDRSADPLTVSYLWSYPVGLDWFVRLRQAGLEASEVLRAQMYTHPMTPRQAQALTPGVPIHGLGHGAM